MRSDGKKLLRKRMLQERQAMAPEERAEFSMAICRHLQQWIAQYNSPHVALYAPFKGEVELEALVIWLRSKSISIFLPRILSQTLMQLVEWRAEEELVTNRWGVLEPKVSRPLASAATAIVIVPALAIDMRGHRLGYGKGYYDRLLSAERFLATIGVCFSRFLLPQLPSDPHDERLQYVATENGVKEITKN